VQTTNLQQLPIQIAGMNAVKEFRGGIFLRTARFGLATMLDAAEDVGDKNRRPLLRLRVRDPSRYSQSNPRAASSLRMKGKFQSLSVPSLLPETVVRGQGLYHFRGLSWVLEALPGE
jgi:hypothetical protein